LIIASGKTDKKRGQEGFLDFRGTFLYKYCMARRLRIAPGGLLYHVLNRAVGRAALFEEPDDYTAFERAIEFGVIKGSRPELSECE
jgi:hypothetical protein